MTTIQATAPGHVAVGNRQRDTSSHGTRRRPMPLAAVALAAALTGGVIGAATAIAAPTLTRDHPPSRRAGRPTSWSSRRPSAATTAGS